MAFLKDLVLKVQSMFNNLNLEPITKLRISDNAFFIMPVAIK